jgi:hypothetical protein
MSFDIVSVGGTGQWFLFQLALHRLQQPEFPLPRRLWVVDRDFNLNDRTGLAATMSADFNRAWGATPTKPNPVDFNQQWCRPALPHNGAQNVATWLGPAISRDVAHAALTERERTTLVERGFHALPRLAAAWASMHGFEGLSVKNVGGTLLPECFSDAELHDGGNVPLVIVGSLAGGTGAGLLPYLFRQARRGEPQSWKRPVVIIAVLPWFNPERGTVVGQSVTWEDSCRNTSYGIRALFRVMRTLQASAASTTGNSWTRCVFAGPALELAELQAPELPQICQERSLVAPVIRSLVQSLPALIADTSAVAQQRPFETGTVQVPSGKYNDGSGVEIEVPIERIANAYAALRAEELSKFPLRQAASALGGVQRVGGLGRVLRDTVVTVSAAPGENVGRFFESFSARLMARRQALVSDIPLAFSATAATEHKWMIEDIDATMTSGAEQRRLLVVADCAKSDQRSVDNQAREAADLLAAVLQRHAADLFVSHPDKAEKRLHHVKIGRRRLLASHPNRIVEATGNPAFCPFNAEALEEEESQLASVYATAGGMAAAFQSRSYATYLSAAHVLDGRIRGLMPGHDAYQIPKLQDALLLWRAAINGLLTRKAVDGARLAEIARTESLLQDFPHFAIYEFEGKVVGFSSADHGFVPHVDWIEDPIHAGPMSDLKARLEQRLDRDATADQDILYAFAHDTLGKAQVPPVSDPPWAKLLKAAKSAPPDVASVLPAQTFGGFVIHLRSTPGAAAVAYQLPLKVDAAKLTRVLSAAEQFPRFLPIRTEEQGIHVVAFDPFGGAPQDVCHFERAGGQNQFIAIDHACLDRAARAVCG